MTDLGKRPASTADAEDTTPHPHIRDLVDGAFYVITEGKVIPIDDARWTEVLGRATIVQMVLSGEQPRELPDDVLSMKLSVGDGYPLPSLKLPPPLSTVPFSSLLEHLKDRERLEDIEGSAKAYSPDSANPVSESDGKASQVDIPLVPTRAQVAAAKLKLTLDRKAGRSSEDWVTQIAGGTT